MRACEVLHEETWLPGWLLHCYRTDEGRWRGVVTYTVGIGETYVQARDQAELRAAGASRDQQPPGEQAQAS